MKDKDKATIKSIFAKEFDLRETLSNSDIASLAGQLINRYLLDYPEEPTYDNGWEELFQIFETAQEFETFPLKASLNAVFKAVDPNEEPEFATVTDQTSLAVWNIKYRSGVRFANEVIKYNRKAQFEWFLSELRKKAAEKISSIYYGVMVAGASAGTNPSAATAAAIGAAINTDVTTMINAGYMPSHIVCNPLNANQIKAAITEALYYANLQNNLATAGIQPLLDQVYNLKVLPTKNVTAKNYYIAEAKHYLVGVKDATEGELVLDTDMDKLHDSTNLYGKFYKGAALLDGDSVLSALIP